MKNHTNQFQGVLAAYSRQFGLLLAVAAGVIGAAMTAEAQTLTSSGAYTYWWRGFTTGDPATASNWSTNDSSTGTASSGPYASPYGVGIFNTSVSNNVSVLASSASFVAGAFIINNSNSTTIINNANYTGLNGFTNNGTAYGVVANPGAGAVLLSGIQPAFSQTWLNNGNGLMIISNGVTASSSLQPYASAPLPLTLTLGGTGKILIKANIVNASAASTISLVYSGTGTLFLSTNNTYTGSTTISSGTLALTNAGTLITTPALTINAGATLDVSAQTNFVLSTTNVLYVSGTGIGSTASAIKAATNGSVNLGARPVVMTYDGSHPALYVSQGTLSVSNNTFIINTASTLPLANGTYAIAQQAGGNINTNSANAYTISGTALSAGSTSSIFASNNVLLLAISNATTNAAPLTGIAPNKYYWIATNNADFATINNWGTNSANTNRASSYPGTTPALNNIALFNYPASNNVATTVSVSTAETFGGLIINNSNTTTFLPTAAAAFTLKGFTNDLSGTLYGIVVNAYAGSAAIGSTNTANDLPLTLGRSQTWLNNGTGLLSISNAMSIPLGTNLTLGGAGNIYFGGSITSAGSLIINESGTAILGANNTYSGGTTIQLGTLALTGAGMIGNGGNFTLNAGGILDASGATSPNFNLGSATTFVASGTGTNVGSTAATIKAATNGTFNLASQPIILTYDGSHPAFYVSQGQLLLVNNAFTVNSTSGQALANGIYPIAQQATGNIAGSGLYSVGGSAVPTGGTNTIVVSNNVVYLTINTPYLQNNTNSQSVPATQTGVAITSVGTDTFWWRGATNADLTASTPWSTNDTTSGTSSLSPISDHFGVGVFNISATNNSAVVAFTPVNDFSAGGFIINNSNSVAIMDNSQFTLRLTGFANGGSSASFGANNTLYGIVVNPGAGPVTVAGVLLAGSQTWLNNGTGLLTVTNNSGGSGFLPNGLGNYSAVPLTLTLGGAGNISISAKIGVPTGANGGSGKLALVYNGSSTLFLSNTNDYSGGTTIASGTLALTNIGTMGSGSVKIGASATLDVSRLTSGVYTLTNNLTVGGTGTNLNTAAATINGVAGGTINLASTPITMNYDGSDPSLYVSQGILYLLNNTFTINTPGQVPLTNGTYVLAQQQTGNIVSGGNYTLQGSALSVGGTGSITVSNNLLLLTISGATGIPQPVSGLAPRKLWWLGPPNSSFGTAANWSTNSTLNSNTGSWAPGGLTTDVAIFDYPASNNVSTTASLTTTYTFGGMIFNNPGSTAIRSTGAGANLTLNGFTNDSSGTYYGIVMNAGAGATSFYITNNGSLPAILVNSSQTWLNNSSNALSFTNQVSLLTSTILTLSGSGNIYFASNIIGAGAVLQNSAGTTYLSASNSYAGGTTIQSGTLVLTGGGTLGISNSVVIGAGGTLDVSGLPTNNFYLPTSDSLIANGTGSGSSAATIKGQLGGTVNLGSSPVMLNYNGASPSLSISQGTLVLSNNVFVINSTTGIPLTNGAYVVGHQAVGNISNLSTTSFSVYGTALANGYTYSLFVSGSDLVLGVGAPYWNASSTNWQSLSAWSLYSSSLNPTLSTLPGIYDTPVFNMTLSNAVNQALNLNGNVSVAGLVFNNSGTTALTGGGTGGYSLMTGANGITLNPGAGAVTIGGPGANQTVTNLLSSNQTWANNSTGTLTVSNVLANGVATPVTLTLAGTGNIALPGTIKTNIAVDYNGSGTLTLGASNTFNIGLTIEQGIVKTLPATGINSAFGNNATVTLGNVQNASTNLNARISLANGTYTNGLVLSPNPAGDLIIGMQPGSTVNLTGGVTGANDLVLYESTTGVLNISNQPINNAGSLTVAPNTDTNSGPTTSAVNVYSAIGANVSSVIVTTNGSLGTNVLVLREQTSTPARRRLVAR